MISTIKVPINLQLINERLPLSNYVDVVSKKFNRQISLPGINVPPQSSRNEIHKLQPIAESREEVIRSADFRKTRAF